MADYLTTDTELTSIANAIRTKGGTAASLTYPTGFVSAINAIPTGGGGGDEYQIQNNSGDYIDLFINNDGNIDSIALSDGDVYPWQAGTVAVAYNSNGEVLVNDGDVYTILPDGQTAIFIMPDCAVSLTLYV